MRDLHPARPRQLVLIGDDLSGTTEAFAAALGGFGGGHVELRSDRTARFAHARDPGDLPARGPGDLPACTAVDLNTRQLGPGAARDRYRTALEEVLRTDGTGVLLLKIDSLLRGNVAAALAAPAPARHRPVIVAPALPAQGRRTIGGRLRIDGVGGAADGRTLPGALEGTQDDIATSVGRPVVRLGLDEVRGSRQRLSALLGDAAEEGLVAVCDAETDGDLDAVAAAAVLHRQPVIAGSAGIAAAVGRALRTGAMPVGEAGAAEPPGAVPACPGLVTSGAPALIVVGTAEPTAEGQVAALRQRGAVVETVDPYAPPQPEATTGALTSALRTGCAVLCVAGRPPRPEHSTALLRHLTTTAAAALRGHPDARLILTGGATARSVLTHLGVETLRLRCEVHPGAVHLTTNDGRDVVTRPGSHGGPDSLVRAAHHLGARLTSPPAGDVQQPQPNGKFRVQE